MVSAYRNVDGTWVVVAINYSENQQPFSIAGQWRCYRTSDVEGETLRPVSVSSTLPPRSITTLVSY
jgi:hypothetical protein